MDSRALEVLADLSPDPAEALALLRQALSNSADADSVQLSIAKHCVALGRHDDACAALDEVVGPGWYGLELRLHAELGRGRLDAGLEAAIGLLAEHRLRGRPVILQLLEQPELTRRADPALVGLAWALLAETVDAPGDAEELRRRAFAALAAVGPQAAPRSRDLATYGHLLADGVQVSDVSPRDVADERPTAVLARARAGSARDRARLAEMAAATASWRTSS